MFVSIDQIRSSLVALQQIHPFFGMSFLAFKEANLPVGRTTAFNLSRAAETVLERHYRPASTYRGYYNPFRTSRPGKRWVNSRYPSTTLQRITKDTFGDALLHPSEREWGWKRGYVDALLSHIPGSALPVFDIAVWLFRDEEWKQRTRPDQLIRHFFRVYRITAIERTMFDTGTIKVARHWLAETPVPEGRLLDLIGWPPGSPPRAGAALQLLELKATGPAMRTLYEPAQRLNLITGDNSLGKTFLLDCIWWALTGSWLSEPAIPRRDAPKKLPSLNVKVGATTGRPQSFSVGYDWDRGEWQKPPERSILAGLAIYSRHDGSFAVWDPASRRRDLQHAPDDRQRHLFIARDDVWNGIRIRDRVLFNGLLADWVLWQVGDKRYRPQFRALAACLRSLSASQDQVLEIGEPTRLREARDIPTLRFSYGEVPVSVASAAVKRIAALGYMLVWTWFEHLHNTSSARRPPQDAMVLLVDEVEAHLHPRWQRLIVPAILKTVRELSPDVNVQLHIATHSPMVMASAEPVFDQELDDLHHLRLDGATVTLEELPFIKRGTSDSWLMSDVFGLAQPRSKEAEEAIGRAKHLQLSDSPTALTVRNVNAQLVKTLAQDDEFWPRWRYFAKQHGIK